MEDKKRCNEDKNTSVISLPVTKRESFIFSTKEWKEYVSCEYCGQLFRFELYTYITFYEFQIL